MVDGYHTVRATLCDLIDVVYSCLLRGNGINSNIKNFPVLHCVYHYTPICEPGRSVSTVAGQVKTHYRLGHTFFSSPVQPDSGVHPASYVMGTGASFPGGKAAGT
jgi:hypothetical protein